MKMKFHQKENRLKFTLVLTVILFYLVTAHALMQQPFPEGKKVISKDNSDETLVSLRMLGALPKQAGALNCTGFLLKPGDEFWIVQIAGVAATSSMIHHINLYACDHAPTNNACECALPNRSTMFAWGRNSPPIRLPPFAGFHIGGKTENQYLFLESHYMHTLSSPDFSTGLDLHITRQKRPYTAGILSPMGIGTLPPLQKQFFMDNCPIFKGQHPIVPIAYQSHSHGLSKLNSAYVVNQKNGQITEIGRGNPLFPESYYPLKAPALNTLSINPGDTIMVRCLYDTSKISTPINTIGKLPAIQGSHPHHNHKEMCFMNILYYSEPGISTKNPFLRGKCTQEQSNSFPVDSTRLLPDNRILTEHVISGNHTGIVHITNDISVNLDMETFSSVRLLDVKTIKPDQVDNKLPNTLKPPKSPFMKLLPTQEHDDVKILRV